MCIEAGLLYSRITRGTAAAAALALSPELANNKLFSSLHE